MPLVHARRQALNSRRTFTAQRESDPESALMHYRARSYDPRTGRFLQADPVRENRISEHYVYVRNNPVAAIDPLGRQTKEELAEVGLEAFRLASKYDQAKLDNVGGFGGAMEREFRNLAEGRGWLKQNEFYVDVQLAMTRDGRIIVSKIGAGGGKAVARSVQGVALDHLEAQI